MLQTKKSLSFTRYILNCQQAMAKLKKRSKLSQQRHQNNQLNAAVPKKNESNQVNKVLTLLDKIKKSSTSSVNDKLITINNILVQCKNDPSVRKVFLKNDLIKIILNDLLKEEKQFDEILVSCFDLLKNLILEEDYDLAIYLWRNGIWEILIENFDKAFKSLPHLDDEKVNQISKDLLLSYISNLVSVIDNLSMELSTEVINSSLVPNLFQSNILTYLLQFIKLDNVLTNKDKLKVLLDILRLIYDLSTLSADFLQNLLENNDFQMVFSNMITSNIESPLVKVYLIGIQLQIFEIKDDLNENLDSLLVETFTVLDTLKYEHENDDEFQIVDLSLDLLTTVIEIKGSILIDNSTKKDKVFDGYCIDNILPFIGKLFEKDFKNDKALICLSNLMIYLNSNGLMNEKLVNDLESLNTNKIQPEFNQLLNSKDLYLIIDYLNFKLNLLEIDPSKFVSQEPQIDTLIELGTKLSKYDEFLDIESQIQFITTLLMYLSIIAKNINNLEVTKTIVEFIIKYNIVEKIEFYNGELSNGLNVSKFHKKYNYLVEESINVAINSIFELFDDDYPYNRELYHNGNLGGILANTLQDYKKIYKNIDKNINLRLKKQTEETLSNLQRFIEYKQTE
ncbi:uncharacterized protein C5L36_0B12480 [Pichia kudriavzevii]|uniref:Synchronized import protein 1 n=1 Tax=Pichia kudriavzevii TaxID=4909 RepID=A0A2U9R470_PICKU|nr:uncharacterized protein C5L36_0B12480 [Pichia kudriavzevii]AWU76021.1 hypothetical protein C5L36_0B12480 [Pichia kudriavzevii]